MNLKMTEGKKVKKALLVIDRVDRQRAAGRQRPLLPDGDAVRADDDGLAGLRLVCR